MVVLVEAVALERDADLAEDLLHGRPAGLATVVVAPVGTGAGRERLVGERLPDLEHLAGAFAPVVVRGHEGGGYRWPPGAAPYDDRVQVILWVVLVVAAYAVGTFPTAVMVGRRLGVDPTAEGSRNPGASNVYRLGGRRAGLIVGAVDMLKGAVPAVIALVVAGRPEAHAVWGAAVAGHVWPITRGLRGGKGVATAGGGGLVLNVWIGLGCAAIFFLTVRVARIASLGSLSMSLAYPILALIVGRPGWEVAVSGGVAAVLVVRHQSNIRRMLRRDESRLDGDDRSAA